MNKVEAVTLALNSVSLEPMAAMHAADLALAAQDGALRQIRVTSVPTPADETAYVNRALEMREAGVRLPC